MPNIKKIFENNRQWVSKKLELDPDYFKNLAVAQNPEYLYIGCSDSRVTAEELMGMGPGDVFVHRNVANQVIITDSTLNAVVQYAVEYLRVKHIIVCGHYGCGGIQAALKPTDMGQMNNWLQSLRDVARSHWDELESIQDHDQKQKRFVELNVQEQALNILKMDHVQKSIVRDHSLKVHGWVFDMYTGKLIDLNIDAIEEFKKIKEIYQLK